MPENVLAIADCTSDQSLGKLAHGSAVDDDVDDDSVKVEKEMTQNTIHESLSEIDSGLTDSAFSFLLFFSGGVLLSSASLFLQASQPFSSSFHRPFQCVSSARHPSCFSSGLLNIFLTFLTLLFVPLGIRAPRGLAVVR